MSEDRISGLDGLRAISLLLVLQAHWVPCEAFTNFTNWGRGGLIVFFVISGFLITGILLDLRDEISSGTRTPWTALKTFYARRSFRIVPIYYLALTFVVWRDLCTATTEDWLWHATFLNNWSGVLLHESIGVYGPTFPWWSLAVEEQFYIFWAPVVLLVNRKAVPWIVGCAICGGIIFRFVMTALIQPQMALVLTFGNVDSLAAGAAVALLTRSARSTSFQNFATGLLFCGLFFWFTFIVGSGFLPSTVNLAFGDTTWYAVFAPLVFLLAIRAYPVIGRSIDNRVLEFIGRRSYGAYVLHHIVAFTLFLRFQPLISRIGVIEFFLYFAVTIALASISYWYFELPVMRLRNKLFPAKARHIPIRLSMPGSEELIRP